MAAARATSRSSARPEAGSRSRASARTSRLLIDSLLALSSRGAEPPRPEKTWFFGVPTPRGLALRAAHGVCQHPASLARKLLQLGHHDDQPHSSAKLIHASGRRGPHRASARLSVWASLRAARDTARARDDGRAERCGLLAAHRERDEPVLCPLQGHRCERDSRWISPDRLVARHRDHRLHAPARSDSRASCVSWREAKATRERDVANWPGARGRHKPSRVPRATKRRSTSNKQTLVDRLGARARRTQPPGSARDRLPWRAP